MKVRNVWNLRAYPQYHVIETEDRQLKQFEITPLRRITEADLTDYEGLHPRDCKGTQMPKYLYPHYGLEEVETGNMTEKIIVRVTQYQKEKIERKGPPSKVIRELIDNMED